MTQNKRFLKHILQCTTCMQTKHFIGINPTLNFLDLCFRTAWYSSLVSHREKKIRTNEELIWSPLPLKQCVHVCVCMFVCAWRALISKTGIHARGQREGFIPNDIIKSARKEKSALSLSPLSRNKAAVPSPSSSPLLFWPPPALSLGSKWGVGGDEKWQIDL